SAKKLRGSLITRRHVSTKPIAGAAGGGGGISKLGVDMVRWYSGGGFARPRGRARCVPQRGPASGPLWRPFSPVVWGPPRSDARATDSICAAGARASYIADR